MSHPHSIHQGNRRQCIGLQLRYTEYGALLSPCMIYIMMKGGNVLVRVIKNVYSFRNIVIDIFVVFIKDTIISNLFLHYLMQGIKEFKNLRRSIVNLWHSSWYFIYSIRIMVSSSQSHCAKTIKLGTIPPIASRRRFVSIQRPSLDLNIFFYSLNKPLSWSFAVSLS